MLRKPVQEGESVHQISSNPDVSERQTEAGGKLLVPLNEVVVPVGIFTHGRLRNSVYSVLVRGLLGGDSGQTLTNLSARTSLGVVTLRGVMRECVSLGWAQFKVGPHGERRYTRHAPGPYVKVLDPVNLSASTVEHKVIILSQTSLCPDNEQDWLRLLACGRSTLRKAFKNLSALGFLKGVDCLREPSFEGMPVVSRRTAYRAGEQEFELDIFNKSMSRARKPADKHHGRAAILECYKGWKEDGRPDLGTVDRSTAARVILAHYSFLASSIEDVFIPLNRQGVAAFSAVIDWVTSQEQDASGDDFDTERIRRLSKGNPQELVFRAVMSTFSSVSTYRKYGVALVTTINESKNTFNSIALNTLTRASRKDPNWYHQLRGQTTRDVAPTEEGSKGDRRIRLRLQKANRDHDRPGRRGDSS